MEMQHVRYFIALAETLNFTRAAERCNVSQPALTRAIQQLEHELGGALLRRERQNSHLTELGKTMLPLLRQCHDCAASAKSLASAIRKGEGSCLSLGIAQPLDISLLIAPLTEVMRRFPAMQLKLKRGNATEIAAMLKSGAVELAISGPLKEEWDRLDAYPMFTEAFDYIIGGASDEVHQDGNDRDAGPFEPGGGAKLLLHQGICAGEAEETRLAEAGIDPARAHQVDSVRDLEALVLARVGIGIAPSSALRSPALKHYPCKFDLKRTVAAFTVAGRMRSPEGAALLSLIRSADWSSLERSA